MKKRTRKGGVRYSWLSYERTVRPSLNPSSVVLVHPSSIPPMFHLRANISCLLSRFRPCMDGQCQTRARVGVVRTSQQVCITLEHSPVPAARSSTCTSSSSAPCCVSSHALASRFGCEDQTSLPAEHDFVSSSASIVEASSDCSECGAVGDTYLSCESARETVSR